MNARDVPDPPVADLGRSTKGGVRLFHPLWGMLSRAARGEIDGAGDFRDWSQASLVTAREVTMTRTPGLARRNQARARARLAAGNKARGPS
jgi:hypothetical protein